MADQARSVRSHDSGALSPRRDELRGSSLMGSGLPGSGEGRKEGSIATAQLQSCFQMVNGRLGPNLRYDTGHSVGEADTFPGQAVADRILKIPGDSFDPCTGPLDCRRGLTPSLVVTRQHSGNRIVAAGTQTNSLEECAATPAVLCRPEDLAPFDQDLTADPGREASLSRQAAGRRASRWGERGFQAQVAQRANE